MPSAYAGVTDGWKIAQPQGQLPKGDWWDIFADPALSALETQASAANQQRLPVDEELAITLPGQARTDAAYAERRCGPVGCCAIDRGGHLKWIQRMFSHAHGPPDLRVIQCEARS